MKNEIVSTHRIEPLFRQEDLQIGRDRIYTPLAVVKISVNFSDLYNILIIQKAYYAAILTDGEHLPRLRESVNTA